MTREEIFNHLSDRNLIDQNNHVILVDGFEDAFLGVTAIKPVKVIYDYWNCLDILIQKEGLDFDMAIDNLEEFINQDLGEQTPLYIKQI